MSDIRRIPATAGADMPHGSFCKLIGSEVFPDPDLTGPGGVVAGAYPAHGQGVITATGGAYQQAIVRKGSPIQLQTDGKILAWINGPCEVMLAAGRIV